MSSIDVIVPCYRYGHYLRECVTSVLEQGVAELRLLIIDDESPDETPEVGTALAREDSRVSYRRHAVNRGHIDTYNEGIDWAVADYTLLLSADDFLLPGALKRAMDLMDAHRDVGLCIGEALELLGDGTRRPIKVNCNAGRKQGFVISGADFVRLCIQAGSNNVVCTPTAVVRTEMLKRLGGYRAELMHAGDLEMWLRLAAHGPVGIVKADQAVYRYHSDNMSRAYYQDHRLGDLQQRKAAFDAFLEAGRGTLPEAQALHRSLLEPLGNEAVVRALSAFNSDRVDLSRRLCQFATSVHPGVRLTWAWNLLAFKFLMGLRAYRALQPAITRIRATMSRMRN